jgi:hypothetical protein
MKLSFVLTLFAASLSVTSALAQASRDVINDLSPDRKASAEAPQAPRSPPNKTGAAETRYPRPGDKPVALPDDGVVKHAMPEDLSGAIAIAIRRNPRIVVADASVRGAEAQLLAAQAGVAVADAKVRQAKADLNELTLKVVSEATEAFREYAKLKKLLSHFKDPSNEASRGKLHELQSMIERVEFRLNQILGIGGDLEARPEDAAAPAGAGRDGEWGRELQLKSKSAAGRENPQSPSLRGRFFSVEEQREARSPAIPKALRAVLAEETVLDFADQPLRDAVEYLSDRHDFQFITHEKSIDVPVTVNISGITLAAALQAIADLTNYCFVFRDYGILVVKEAEAELYEQNGAAMIAPGRLPPVIEDRDSDAAGGEKQPAEAVQRQ